MTKLISKALRMERVKGITQFYLPPACLSTNGMSYPAFISSRRASPYFGQYSFPHRIGGWVSLGEVVCPPEDGHSIQYQPTDSAAAGNSTHDHCVASPTPWTPDYRAIISDEKYLNSPTGGKASRNAVIGWFRWRQRTWLMMRVWSLGSGGATGAPSWWKF